MTEAQSTLITLDLLAVIEAASSGEEKQIIDQIGLVIDQILTRSAIYSGIAIDLFEYADFRLEAHTIPNWVVVDYQRSIYGYFDNEPPLPEEIPTFDKALTYLSERLIAARVGEEAIRLIEGYRASHPKINHAQNNQPRTI